MKKIGFLFLLLVGAIAFLVSHQEAIPLQGGIHKVFPKQAYQADLQQLAQLLRDQHPQPFAHQTAAEFETLVNQQMQQLTDTTQIGSFVWQCRALIASIGCGHTNIFRPQQTLGLPIELQFPIFLQFINQQAFLTEASELLPQIPRGTEILSINGIDPANLQKKIYRHLSSDGYNKSAYAYRLNAEYHKYLPYQFNFPRSYTFEFRTDSTTTQKVMIPAGLRPKAQQKKEQECQDQLCFKVDTTKRVAILKIRSFAFYGDKLPYFKGFLDESFATIADQNITKLLLDFRDNGGGDPYCAVHLLQYLADHPFRYFEKNTFGYPDLQEEISVFSNRYQGKTWILINGGGFSTTGHISALLKHHNWGDFVGQATAASYRCNDNSTQIHLNKTGLRLYLPTLSFGVAVDPTPIIQGIVPDSPIIPSLAKILSGEDYMLKEALQKASE
ncbi:MAG: S41 family peptidase [Saprospiraceae bacterium]